MSQQSHDLMRNLTRAGNAVSARCSSWDQTGGNKDYWLLAPHQTAVLANLDGPGCINHIWMTSFCRKSLGPSILDLEKEYFIAPTVDVLPVMGVSWEGADPDYYRKVLIKITWDDLDHPSVLAPLGDFFGVCNSMPGSYGAMPFTVSVNPENLYQYGGPCAMNCYFPMPFQKRARIEIVNENDLPLGLFFAVDYELARAPLPADTVYFHAQWHRNNPCDGWGPELPANCPEVNSLCNLDGEGNYVMLSAEGKGHFVGCNLAVISYQGVCWCEGDDMIFIDGEKTPRINGSGSEDYFNHAWGIQRNSFLFNGSIFNERDIVNHQFAYRFHIADPIYFDKSIRVTFEHGHANHLSDDWSSTAYWYQTLPSRPFGIAELAQRLPNKIFRPEQPVPATAAPMTEDARAASDAYKKRFEQYKLDKEQFLKRNAERTRSSEQGNLEAAKRVRAIADQGR
jgi:hypothetical protein